MTSWRSQIRVLLRPPFSHQHKPLATRKLSVVFLLSFLACSNPPKGAKTHLLDAEITENLRKILRWSQSRFTSPIFRNYGKFTENSTFSGKIATRSPPEKLATYASYAAPPLLFVKRMPFAAAIPQNAFGENFSKKSHPATDRSVLLQDPCTKPQRHATVAMCVTRLIQAC